LEQLLDSQAISVGLATCLKLAQRSEQADLMLVLLDSVKA